MLLAREVYGGSPPYNDCKTIPHLVATMAMKRPSGVPPLPEGLSPRNDCYCTRLLIKAQVSALDEDGSGKVDLHEYVRFSLRDALYRSSERVIDLFRKWDVDESGEIDKKEFRKAIRSMGFNFFTDDAEIDMVFDDFDLDKSGKLDYKELNQQLRLQADIDPNLRPGAAGAILQNARNKSKLRRRDPAARMAANVTGSFQLDDSQPVQEQLRDLLTQNAVRVIDLFREWDEDGDGTVSKKEFRKAMPMLGLQLPEHDRSCFWAALAGASVGATTVGGGSCAASPSGASACAARLAAPATIASSSCSTAASSASPPCPSGATSTARR